MIKRNPPKYFTTKESKIWLDDKCKELDIESIEELEEYASKTDDFNLSSEINLHIMAYMDGLYDFFVTDHLVSLYEFEMTQLDSNKQVKINKKNILNLNQFKNLDHGDRGQILQLNVTQFEIVKIKE